MSRAALLWGLLAGCAAAAPAAPPGVLAGQVTLGPVRPSQRTDQPAPPMPLEAYAARALRIRRADGAAVVRVPIGPDGAYRIALPPGVYVVELAGTGGDRAPGLPRTIAIHAGEALRLDVRIDTGLR